MQDYRAFKNNKGGSVGARTPDPLIKSQLLYQLSYKTLILDGEGTVKN